jgi:hypothetical protein
VVVNTVVMAVLNVYIVLLVAVNEMAIGVNKWSI